MFKSALSYDVSSAAEQGHRVETRKPLPASRTPPTEPFGHRSRLLRLGALVRGPSVAEDVPPDLGATVFLGRGEPAGRDDGEARDHGDEVEPAGPSLTAGRAVEIPSLLLCCGIYGGFAVSTLLQAHLPALVFAPLAAIVLALHSSMQHEFIHGHPTRWRRLNRALAGVPLALWLPFEFYRRSHLKHHRDERLTDPFDDPESYYWSGEGWTRLGPLGRGFIRLHSTLLGRLTLGPAWTIGKFLLRQSGALLRREPSALRIWAWHGLGVAAVLLWVVGLCGIDFWFYLFAVVYPSLSILLLRSYAEHRAEIAPEARTAIVENAPIFGFLFLYNNLHAAHHVAPGLPWYVLPGWYHAHRAGLIARNQGLVYAGYADVARRFLLRPHHVAVHPLTGGRRPATAEAAAKPRPDQLPPCEVCVNAR